MPRSRPSLFFTVIAAALSLSPVLAYADDRAAAQQLFQQGKELMRAGNVAEACPKFEAAEQFSATPGVRLNLAECWLKLGRTASAWGKYDEALVMAERTGDATAAALARSSKTALEPMLTHLTVVVGADARVAGLVVQRDGQTLPAAAWGVAIPVDPGEHTVSADAPGRQHWSAAATLPASAPNAPGGTATVAVPMLAMVPSAIVDAPPVDASRRKTQRMAAWVTGGVGVVGIGVATYFAIHAISEKSDYRSHLTSAGQCADPTCQTDSHSAYVAGNVATGGFIAGGALLATGVVLFLTAPAALHASTAQLVPLVTPHMAGVGMTASW